MFNSHTRSELLEIMDQQDNSADDVISALLDIGKVNKYLGGYTVILNALDQLNWQGEEMSVLDVGSGGGDTLRAIADWAKDKKCKVHLTGIDINPSMTTFASAQAKKYSNIIFKTYDVFDDSLLKEKSDVVMSNLFCHHFDHDALVRLVIRMNELSKSYVIINDLHRHWFAFYSIKFITGMFSKSYMVKYDAPLSVARSLTKLEWEEIINKAGILNYKIKWCWAWRWQIIIRK